MIVVILWNCSNSSAAAAETGLLWSCSAGCGGGGEGTVAPVIVAEDEGDAAAGSSVVAEAADASVVRCMEDGSLTQDTVCVCHISQIGFFLPALARERRSAWALLPV